jgi:hypothetical protein
MKLGTVFFNHQTVLLAQENIVFGDNLVTLATRSFSVEGPTMVPASNRIIQFFFPMLSSWIGI